MALINPAILLDPPCEPGCPRKRRRLDNLTPEERALRRKLKNRVAAQTARDRKKARMTELEESLALYEEQNKELMKENKNLKLRASTLETENTELKTRLGLTPPSSPTSSEDTTPSPLPSPPHSPSQDEPSVIVVKQEKESTEYAELSVSQQKEHSPIPFLSLLTTTVLLHLLRVLIGDLGETFQSLPGSDYLFRQEVVSGRAVYLDNITVNFKGRRESDELLSFLEDFKPGNPDDFISIKQEPEDVLIVCAGEPEISELKQERGDEELSDGMGKDAKCLEPPSGEFMTTIELDKAIENYAAEPSMNENMWWEESFPELFPTLA